MFISFKYFIFQYAAGLLYIFVPNRRVMKLTGSSLGLLSSFFCYFFLSSFLLHSRIFKFMLYNLGV
jgi:hypothetical protein